MCQPATCSRCGKATYRGCGQHVDQVLAGVPQARRCSCADLAPKAPKRSWNPFSRR